MTETLVRKMTYVGLLMLVLVQIPAFGEGETEEPERILIQNVRMIDRDGKSPDRNVNILIRKSKLNLITMDKIGLEEGMIGFDAQNGIVLGVLSVGQTANFMILDQDPRENIEVLLDTKAHVVFAIHQGTIVTNTLSPIAALKLEPKEKRPKWLAYEPPPMALPLTYLDANKWNRWNTRYFSGIFVAAIALDRQRWMSQDANSKQEFGDLQDYDGGEIRALRVGIAGTLNFKLPWFYQFIVHTHAFDLGYNSKTSDEVTFLDYRLDIPLSRQFALSIGKQKEPISMDRLLMGTQLQMAERATVLDAMFTVRNVGIVISGNGFFGGRMTGAIGIFNDWFDAGQSFNESASQVTGRVTGLAYVNEDDSHLLHLALAARYNDAKEGLRYYSCPEFHLSPVFVDTGAFEADSTFTYHMEMSWRRGPHWLAAEFVRKVVNAPELGDPAFSGFFVSGSWILTGEMRVYNRRNGTMGPIPVSKSVYQGGIGAWEVTARFSSLNLSDGLVDGGKVDVISLGLNWSLTPTFTVNLNYRNIFLNRYGVKSCSGGIMGRVILVLE